MKYIYYMSYKYIAKYHYKRITIYKNKKKLIQSFEEQYLKELKKRKKYYIIELRKKSINYNQNNNKKEIWIISDRLDKAGDNGEYFFRYLKDKKPKRIKSFFVIRKNCSDYKSLKELGDILEFGSTKHLNMFLKADKIISSMSNPWVDNPFGEDRKYIMDLFHFDFIFLQHGITKDDLSEFLNRLNKNFSLFITSAKREYKSIFAFNYGYKRKNVLLTGFPRFDIIYRFNKIVKKEKLLLIIPTWRENIKGTINTITYESIHSDIFKFTNFFNFYNSLINDRRLIFAMKKYNYTGIFCLHPRMSSQYIDFNKNQIFSIKNKCEYQEYFIKASLLVTDYSSIFFDFAYLRKPVIYAHFDYEEYRKNHYKKGYFDYEKDGFGPISYDLKSTINEIINEIENNCSLKKKYLKRINKFFTYFDGNNNERVYKAIINNHKNFMEPIIIINIILIIIYARIKIMMKNNIFKDSNYD